MATIPTDVYVLRNIQHLSFASFVNDNDKENAISETAPTDAEPAKPIGHKWKITANQNGTYEIFNEMHKLHARISGDRKNVESTRDTEHSKAIWRIIRIPGQPGFWIRDINGDLCWKLPCADTRTPVDLVAPAPAKDTMWVFESKTTRYPSRDDGDDKIPTNILQTREKLLGNGGSMPVFDFQADKTPSHKLDIVLIQPAPIVGMVPASATLSRFAESISRLANKSSLHVDVRLGAVTYATVGDEAFSSVFHLAPFDRLSKSEISGFLPRSEDYFAAALRDALNMDWREDAAKMLVFAPLVGPTGYADYRDSEYQRSELIKQLKARNILLTVNADGVIRDQYMDRSPFFRTLKVNALNENATIPQDLLLGWTFASTFYKNSISALLDAFGIRHNNGSAYNNTPSSVAQEQPSLSRNVTVSGSGSTFYSRRNVTNVIQDGVNTGSEARFRSDSMDGNDRAARGNITTEFSSHHPPNVHNTPPSPFNVPTSSFSAPNSPFNEPASPFSLPTSPFSATTSLLSHPAARLDSFFTDMKPLGHERSDFFRENLVQSFGNRRPGDVFNDDTWFQSRGFTQRPSTATGFATGGADSPFSQAYPNVPLMQPNNPTRFGSDLPGMSSSSMFEWKSSGGQSNLSFSSNIRRSSTRDGYMSS